MEKKENRGGKREGSGRKKLFNRILARNKTFRIAGDKYDEDLIKIMNEARDKFYIELEEKEKK